MGLKIRSFINFFVIFVFAQFLSAADQTPRHKTPTDFAIERMALNSGGGVLEGIPSAALAIEAPFAHEISEFGDFIKLAQTLDSDIGRDQLAKIVYDRRDGEIYFINTPRYPYHIDFATRVLNWVGSGSEFNRNYEGTGENRSFNLATLSLSPRQIDGRTEFLLEIWNGDSLEGEYLKELYSKVRANLADEFVLTFHPLSDLHVANVSELGIPFVVNDDLFADKEYWPLSRFDAVGYVRVISEITDEVMASIEPSDIVVFLDGVPNEIGFVAGIVTESFQTPLSHINIKSKNRGTANISHKRAREIFSLYEGKYIKLTVGVEEPVIEDRSHLDPTTIQEEIAAFWDTKRPHLDDGISEIVSHPIQDFVDLRTVFASLPNRDKHSQVVKIVGAKAANLGVLNYLSNQLNQLFAVHVPPAFGLPFYFYGEFMKGILQSEGQAITLEKYIKNRLRESGLDNPNTFKTRSQVEPILSDIREKYTKIKIPDSVLEVFRKAIFDDTDSPFHISKKIPRIRLRSSTNSEDLEGFTGAGLYESKGINLFKKFDNGKGYHMDQPRSWEKIKKSLKKKLPQIYAGVWNTRAFMEREWFRLNGEQHLRVMCALAVHQAFPFYGKEGVIHELANGVAATRNIYKPDSDSGVDELYINGQHWDLAVTNPPSKTDLIKRGESSDINKYRTEENIVTAFANDPAHNNRSDAYRWWFAQKLKSSSAKGGDAVLVDLPDNHNDRKKMEVRRIGGAFYFLERKLARVYGRDPRSFNIEGEWKVLDNDRKLVIKQIREFPKTRTH